MRIHFIAIGGAAMHNLAIALKSKGWKITGSDDAFFDPSESRLREHGLLPDEPGWYPEKLSDDIDLVILGMHALKDNPELFRARELGLTIQSYPEFIYHQSLEKKRIVIAGSHGKTTTTSMILHVLKTLNLEFDFMVGAQIEGFDNMVRLSDAPLIILEGDEYFSSPVDPKAKFLWYKPHIALITGIAWDHINVYPTFESYEKCFSDFISGMEDGGKLFYFEDDCLLKVLAKFADDRISTFPYGTPDYKIENGKTILLTDEGEILVGIFGEHNLQNLEGARWICNSLGISDQDFYHSITTFEGAKNRMELIHEDDDIRIFRDFAHSPSKLKATVDACKKQYNDGKLLAIMELHTFSSLNKKFLKEYKGCMDSADTPIVFYSPETIAHKKLEDISMEDVRKAFNRPDLRVVASPVDLRKEVISLIPKHRTLLIMSSGNLGGIDIQEFVEAGI